MKTFKSFDSPFNLIRYFMLFNYTIHNILYLISNTQNDMINILKSLFYNKM